MNMKSSMKIVPVSKSLAENRGLKLGPLVTVSRVNTSALALFVTIWKALGSVKGKVALRGSREPASVKVAGGLELTIQKYFWSQDITMKEH
jgi:hypothetical protein